MNILDIANNLPGGDNQQNSQFAPSPNDTPRIRALKEKLAKREALRKENSRVTDAQKAIQQQGRQDILRTPQVQSAEDYASTTLGNTEEAQAQDVGAQVMGTASSAVSGADKYNEGTEFNVDAVYADAMTKFSENFMVGLGNMIGDYGNIAQVVGSALGINSLAEGNFLSRGLQSIGNEMASENAMYIPPELQDPNFSISTMLNPDFWLIHGAQFTPQLLEILGTMGAGSAVTQLTKHGLERGLTKYFAKELGETAVEKGALEASKGMAKELGEEAVKNVAEKAAKRGIVGTTVGTTAKGAGVINEYTQGARGLGRLIRDTGKLSEAGQKVAGATGDIAGGVLTNMRVSIANAGEVYNTYASMKNEDGTPMFTKEELAQMTSQTFSNNMQYMMMDILSWSMTYGGGKAMLGEATSGLRKTLSESAQRKVSGALMAKGVAPAVKKGLEYAVNKGVKFANKGKGFAKWATTGALEGLEESIQEVHEEWSKMKAYEEATGSLVNWQGIGPKQHTDSFWDFYTSKEMEGTRTIAGLLGAASGGIFNIKQLVNKSADDAHQMNTRAERLKSAFKAGTEDAEMQQYEIESSIREQVFQGKEAYSEGFLNDMVNKQILTEDKANELRALRDEAIEAREKTNLLNINGKKAYFTSLMQEKSFSNLIENENDKFKIRVGELNEQFSNLSEEEKQTNPDYLKAYNDLQDVHEAAVGSLMSQVELAQQNKRNLLAGKPAEPIYLKSAIYKGNLFYYNASNEEESTEEEKKRELSEKDEEIAKAKATFKKGVQTVKDGAQKLGEKINEKIAPVVEKAKSALESLKETFSPSNVEVPTDENIVPAEYIKASKPLEEMSFDEIDARAVELQNEKNRIKDEMVKLPKEEQKPYAAANNEIDKEIDGLIKFYESKRVNDFKAQNSQVQPTSEEVEGNKVSSTKTKEKQQSDDDITDDDLNDFIDSKKNGNPKATSKKNKLKDQEEDDSLGDKFLGDVRESRGKRGKKSNSNTDTNTDTDTEKNKKDGKVVMPEEQKKNKASDKVSTEEQISEVAGKAYVGTKRGVKSLLDKGKAFGMKMMKNSGNAGKMKYYREAIATSEIFGHQFITRMNEINNSGLWNGKEKPNVYFVHSINQLDQSVDESTPGIYSPLLNSIFLKQDAWDDNLTYHHEFLHYNYAYMENTEEMKSYLTSALAKFPKLYQDIRKLYNDKIDYTLARHVAENWSKTKINNRIKWLKQQYPQASRKEIIEIMNADSIVVRKSDLNISEEKFEQLIKDGSLNELPPMEQSIVLEEFFVATQEGPRSEKYNMYFEEKQPRPERNIFWKKIKDKVDRAYPTERDKENAMLDGLTVDNFAEFTDIKSAVWKEFSSRFPKGSMDYQAREKRIDDAKEVYVEDAKEVYERIDDVKTEFKNREENLESTTDIQDESEETLDVIADNFFSNEKNASEKAITSKIHSTIESINKRLNEIHAEQIAEDPNDVSSPVLLDVDALEQEMFERAKDSEDFVDFFLQMKYSEIPEIKLMMKSFARGKGQNSDIAILKAFYNVNRYKHNTLPIITRIGENGSISIEDAKTSSMRMKSQQILKNLEQKAGNQTAGLEFSNFVNNMEIIRTTPISEIDPKTILEVLQFFGDKSIDYNRIMDRGYLVLKGQNYAIAPLLKSIAKRSYDGKFTFDPKTKSYIKFNPYVHNINHSSGTKFDIYGYRVRTDDIDRRKNSTDKRKATAPKLPLNNAYAPMVDALLSTDAMFKNSKSYRDANGNLNNARMSHNAALGIFEKMSNEILNNLNQGNKYSKQKFISTFGNISKEQKGTGKFSNALLSHIYDTVVKTGLPYEVQQDYGVRNDVSGNAKTLKDQTSGEDAFSQLVLFDQFKRFGSYYMDLGRFSTSSRKFLINVPIQKNIFNKDFSLRKTTETMNAFNIFKNQNSETDITFENFAYDLKKMLENEFKYWEIYKAEMKPEVRENISMLKTGDLKTLKPLTDAQKSDIADFFYNQLLNGLYSNEIIFPDFKFAENDLIKRAASGSTTFVPIGKKVGHEIIYFNDGSEKNADTDGTAYILKEDFDKIKNASGRYMPINGHAKMAHVGVEYAGPEGMDGVSQYDKPLYVAIDENYVKQNPKLKPLFELMKARKAKWEEQNGSKGSEDYADGTENHLITAVSLSAEKTKNPLKKEWAIDLDKIQDEDYNEKLDNIYYKDNTFRGFSGDNIGVQIVMNNNVNESIVPSQLISFLTTGGGNYGDFENLRQTQQYIFDEMQKNIEKLDEIASIGNIDDITRFVKEEKLLNKEQMDHISRMILFQENLNVAVPQVKELVMNTLKQYIIRNGNKLSTPGTQARVVPSFSYTKKFTIDGQDYEIEELHDSMAETAEGEYISTYESYDSGLQDYKKTYQKIDGKWVAKYEPGEMVAPKNLEDMGVRKRQYFMSWDKNTSENSKAYRDAVKYAIQNGLSESDVKRFRLKNSKGLESSYGFYVPGETVMATRIPSHGPQSTGFFEVVDFEVTGTSQVQVPKKFTKVTGQDHDGDALFINVKDKKNLSSSWNKAFDEMKNHWLSPGMQEIEINQELNFEEEAIKAINYLKEKVPNAERFFKTTEYLHTPEGRRNQFDNTLISKGNIGSVMSLHRTYSLLSNYDVEFKTPIQIGNKYNFRGFTDFEKDGTTRTILSANIANMILDDVKNGLSTKLGVNSNTIKYVMPLINMGVDLGDIAVIMNSDLMKKWNELNEFNDNLFTKDEYLNQDILSKETKIKLLGSDINNKVNPNINFDDINSLESKAGIMKLISELSSIQNDMHKLNNIIRGHNDMETNPFISQKNLDDFDNFLENKTQTKKGFEENFLVVSDDLRNSPMLKNYRKNAELLMNIGKKMDVVFTEKGKAIWKTAITDNPKNISKEKQIKFHSAAEKFVIAQYLGLAGQDVKEYFYKLLDGNNKDNVFNKLGRYMSQPIDVEETASKDRKTNVSNVLFQKAMLVNTHGKHYMKDIRLNGVISDDETSQTLRDVAKNEFSKLPTNLQRDLIAYDLIKNGFSGRNSLFPLFSDDVKNQIQDALDLALSDKNNKEIFEGAHREFLETFLGNNQNEYLVKTTNYIMNVEGKISINYPAVKNNKDVINALESSINNGNVVYFKDARKLSEKGPEVSSKVYRITPFSNKDIQTYNEIKNKVTSIESLGLQKQNGITDEDYFLMKKTEAKIKEVNFSSINPEVDNTILSNTSRPRLGIFGDLKERRIASENYFKAEDRLTESQFENLMEFPKNLENEKKKALYQEYLAERAQGEILNKKYSDKDLQNMSDDDLMKLYSGNENAENPRERGIGYQNKYAYAKILNRVTKEIAIRVASEQVDLIRKNNPDFKGPKEEKDLGTIQSWLITSNIPSDNPALQGAIRKIKSQEKVFKKEKAKYMKRLNEVTSALYLEKFGFDPYTGFMGKVRYVKNEIMNFFNKSDAMKVLYGNLIKEEIIEREDGSTIRNMRYHDEDYLADKLKKGEISKAEWDFYKETTAMMKEFEPFVVKSNRGSREQYIPHVAPSMMEAYSRRGLLGVMINMKTIDEQLGDVKLEHNGKLMSYDEVVADYMMKSRSKENSGKLAVELFKLKTKATKLLNKGINEDGSKIRYSNIGMGSALGDVFMNEFSGQRGIKASEMPSWDLNKAFSEYFHGALWNSGNGIFTGFKEMLPVFDGIIANSYEKNMPNTVKYVEKVWRQYFLQGAKQHHTKTPAELKALGITTDNVIDFITKSSLFYWLGYKGLIIGNGVYAIGNVLAGKYNHIKDAGNGKWAIGEKRFWKGSGSFDLTDPLKGLKQSMAILKKAGFMDINIYDDAPLHESNGFGSFLGDIALMPMSWSEKWIQGVQFLGELTETEYQKLANEADYNLPESRLNEIESSITLSQGRGYQPTDQRMIQMYSYGRMATQFSRWIPTTIYNLFGKEDYDIYGQKYIGSYRAFGKLVSRFVTGEISPAEYKKYRDTLNKNEKARLDSALRGFGLMTLAAGGVFLGFEPANKLLSDMNIFLDVDRMSNKLVPPAISMTANIAGI